MSSQPINGVQKQEHESKRGPEDDGVILNDNILWKIPQELRDLVYKLVLSEPDGLFYRKQSDGSFKGYKSRAAVKFLAEPKILESNQLKFVSRGLRQETKGLGITCNNLNFVQKMRHTDSAIDQFLSFVNSCDDEKLKMAKVVRLEEVRWAHDRQLVLGLLHGGLRKFCLEHPNITVWHTCHRIDKPDELPKVGMLLIGVALKSTVRGENLLDVVRYDTNNHVFQQDAARSRQKYLETEGSVEIPNLRQTMPHMTETDEARFRQKWQEAYAVLNIPENEFATWMDEIIAAMKDWAEHGI